MPLPNAARSLFFGLGCAAVAAAGYVFLRRGGGRGSPSSNEGNAELRINFGNQFPHPAHLSDRELCEVCAVFVANLRFGHLMFVLSRYLQAFNDLVPLNRAASVARVFSPTSVMSSPHEFFVLLDLPPEVIFIEKQIAHV